MLPVYEALSGDAARRQARWRKWVHTPVTERELGGVRRSLASGRRYGEGAGVQATAAAVALPLSQRPRGRPRKGEKGTETTSPDRPQGKKCQALGEPLTMPRSRETVPC